MIKRDAVPIAIVGGGVAGLALGAFLAPARHDWTIVESRPASALKGGAALAMAPNAMWVLRRLGVADRVTKEGSVITRYHFNRSDGRSLKVVDMTPLFRPWGEQAWCVPRSDLLASLERLIPEGHLELGTPVEGVQDTGQTFILEGSGGPRQALAVIGADGAWSTVRQAFWPRPEPQYQGFVAVRGTLDWEVPAALHASVMQIWGPQGEFGFAPMGQGRTYWFATLAWPDPQSLPTRDHLLKHFHDWCDPVETLIAVTPEASLLIHPIYDRPVPFPETDRPVTLIGDAAHLMTPNTGQGACQSLLDAYVLGKALGNGQSLTRAFSQYRAVRSERALAVARLSRRLGQVIHHPQPIWRQIRDGAIVLAPEIFIRKGMADAIGTPEKLALYKTK